MTLRIQMHMHYFHSWHRKTRTFIKKYIFPHNRRLQVSFSRSTHTHITLQVYKLGDLAPPWGLSY